MGRKRRERVREKITQAVLEMNVAQILSNKALYCISFLSVYSALSALNVEFA